MARKQADKATTIWQALDAWAKTLEGWQQRIIAGAVDHRTLTAEEIKKVYAELLNPGEEKVEVSAPDRPASADAPLLLHKIDTLIGVNALRDDASLTFGRGLTVIFGRNGVGKSGFVRVISNACFCRNTPDIVPNIYKDDTPTVSSARFYAQLGNSAATPIDYPGGADHAVLKRIAVFDSSVAKEVLSQPSAFEFRPRGFDVFTEMVRVYGELTHLLDEDLASRNTATDFSTSFIAPVTDVSTAVSQITADTDMDALKALGVYGDVERARLKQLDEQLTALKARSPKAVLESLREAKGDIEGLIAKLRTAGAEFSDTAQTTRQQLVPPLGTRQRQRCWSVLTRSSGHSSTQSERLNGNNLQRPPMRSAAKKGWSTPKSGTGVSCVSNRFRTRLKGIFRHFSPSLKGMPSTKPNPPNRRWTRKYNG